MQSFKNILIPTDFSPAAWNAMQYGMLFQQMHKCPITLLHVYPIKTKYGALKNGQAKEVEDIVESLKRKMDRLSDNIEKARGSNVVNVVRTGNVVDEIINFYRDGEFDLIIMGVNSGSSSNSPGFNAGEIIKNFGFPVFLVPATQEEKVA
ncbi:MAG: universal stress protein [Bacteroidota bacterium]